MREEPRLRGLPMFGLAMAGLVLGHVLAYLIAVPDPNHRSFVLQRTGHEYMSAFGEAALVLALAGVAALIVRAVGPVRSGIDDRFSRLAVRLGIVQVLAFGGQEVLERIIAGAPLRHLAHDHILAIGIGVQILVAVAGAALLCWLLRTTTKLAETVGVRASLPRSRAVLPMPGTAWRPMGNVLAPIRNVRGPPSF